MLSVRKRKRDLLLRAPPSNLRWPPFRAPLERGVLAALKHRLVRQFLCRTKDPQVVDP